MSHQISTTTKTKPIINVLGFTIMFFSPVFSTTAINNHGSRTQFVPTEGIMTQQRCIVVYQLSNLSADLGL